MTESSKVSGKAIVVIWVVDALAFCYVWWRPQHIALVAIFAGALLIVAQILELRTALREKRERESR